MIVKTGAMACMMQCNLVEVLPRISGNCTEEIPVTWRNGTFFIDLISYVIKMPALPTWCNDIALPRWNIASKWYYTVPVIQECALPENLPVEAFYIDEDDLLDLGLGRSIYSKEQVEEFLRLNNSQGTRKAYLAETVELTYGTWGLGMGEQARGAIIDTVGLSLITLYRILGPMVVTLLLLLFIWGLVRLVVTTIMQLIAFYRARGLGLWILGAFWSLPFQLLITPLVGLWYCRHCRPGQDQDGVQSAPLRCEEEQWRLRSCHDGRFGEGRVGMPTLRFKLFEKVDSEGQPGDQ